MGTDDETSEDEEEILVYVEFEGLVDGNVFSEKQLQLDMIGIDTEHPIMQINGKFYEGTYEDVIGTYMFFTKNDNSTVDDPVFDVAPNCKYFAKTRKLLKMQRIFIKSRTEVLGDSDHKQCIPNLNTLEQAGIPFKYQKKALSFWETMRNNRLNALHTYLEKQRMRQQKQSQGIMLESESDEDNPFAIYKHKEESGNLNKSENIDIDLGKESSSCDNQIYPQFMYPKETDESSDITKDSLKNQKRLKKPNTFSEPESLASKSNSCHLIKPRKGYKTKVSQKRKLTTICNRQRIQLRKRQSSLKEKISPFDAQKRESLNFDEKSNESNKSNIAETFNSLAINEDKNVEGNNKSETAVTEKSILDCDETNSSNSKITKQLKREAKMKEISQQLKIIAEHLNPKTDEHKCT